jgi:long-chain acyl-CoA synthetase
MAHMTPDTWPKVLTHNYRTYGNRHNAMRYKHYGIWRPYTWEDYYLEVKHTALGLVDLGFRAGDKLLIVGENAHEWYAAELAAQANLGISVGIHPEAAVAQIERVAQDSQARFAIVEGQEQVDKLLEIEENLPLLEGIIYWNYKGLTDYDDPLLLGHKELILLGQGYDREHPGSFEKNVDGSRPQDVCALVYMPKTDDDGALKRVPCTHEAMRAAVDGYLKLDPWRQDDNIIPFLPPVSIVEQLFAVGCHLMCGNILNLAEEPGTLLRDVAEIEPTIAFYGARMWEGQAAMLESSMRDVAGLKRLAFRSFMPVGYEMAEVRSRKDRPGMFLKMAQALADAVLFKPIRKCLGLSEARICYCTGAALGDGARRLYHALNIPVRSVYAATEDGMGGGTSLRIELDEGVHQ